MDLFFAICQGLGLALAVGVLAGAPGLEGRERTAFVSLAAVAGAVLFAVSLQQEGYAAWPGIVPGAPLAGFAALVTTSVVAGARERAEAPPIGITILVAAVAGVVGLLSILLPPVGLIAVAAAGWLWYSRQQRASRTHEGLRVLR